MKLPLLILVALSFVHCSEKPEGESTQHSAEQSQSSHPVAQKAQVAQEVQGTASTLADTGTTKRIAIQEGSLRDASVTVPAGSLAIDTKVTAKQGKQPKAFKVKNSKKASQPLVIEATDGDEQKVVASSSMKISIPIKEASFSLYAAKRSHSKLAVLHSDKEGRLTIWRRHKIAVVKGYAIFKSRKFGTYQLVFLGSDPAEEFMETEEEAPEEKEHEDKDDEDKEDKEETEASNDNENENESDD